MTVGTSKDEEDKESGKEIKRNAYVQMGTYDFVRRDIERFFANPEQAIISPGLAGIKPTVKPPPDFIRNVWGSSSGVGSSDFHVYQGIRRREYARLELIEKTSEEEKLNEEYQKRQKELDELAAAKTAKKRAKRQKKKSKQLQKKKSKQSGSNNEDTVDDQEASEALSDSNDGTAST